MWWVAALVFWIVSSAVLAFIVAQVIRLRDL